MLRVFALICIFFFGQWLQAQSLRLESISIHDGLSQSYVPCILQDREGFVWMGTKNGLNRFDGREFQVFTHDPEDPFSISDDQVWAMAEMGDFLLVANSAGNLDFYHKQSRRFFHLPLTEDNSKKAPYTRKVFLDAIGNIWLVTGEFVGTRHLCVIAVPENFWKRLANEPKLMEALKPKFVPTDKVFSAVCSKAGDVVYYNTGESYYAVDIKTLQQTPIHWPLATKPIDLEADSAGKVWVTHGGQLSCFDGTHYQDYPMDFEAGKLGGFVRPGLALFGVAGEILAIPIATIQATGKVRKSMAEWKIPCSELMLCQLQDASGNVWIGLNGKGILKFNPDFRQIRHLFEGSSVYGPVFSEANGTVVAILPLGLQYFPDDKQSPTARALRQINSKISGLCRASNDKTGNRWLYVVSKPKSKLIRTALDGAQKSFDLPLFLQTAGNLLADNDGTVWLAAERTLLHFDPSNEHWEIHSLEQALPITTEIYCLAKTPDGTLWLGTQSGLLEAKPTGDGGFSYLLHTPESGELRNKAVSSLLPDPSNPQLLWIATKGGGLSRLDLKSRQFSSIYSRNGLPNDVLYGILADPQGNLWMSSNRGIIRYNPATGSIQNFTEADGLQSNEFNTWAYGHGPGGTLMFGGINGLNILSPKDFEDNPHFPPVFLTGLSINNRPIGVADSTGVLPQAIEFSKNITLSFEQRSISLSFAALEFTTTAKNRFRWILEGAETNWNPETTERNATYLNLQPGSYTFKVMAANGDGVWNPNPVVLKIEVLPPWYRSAWAYLVYFVLIAGLIYSYLRFRLSQLRLKQQLELEYLNAERLRELDKFKSQVFTNVSHEFRTPLTVILGMAEQLESQLIGSGQQQSAVQLIKRNGQNLLRLINQILDLARLESNILKINYVQGDVLAFIRYTAESMHSLASVKNVLFRVESHVAEGKIVMDYDPERLLHILHNLLSNAIKFTASGGRVTLQVGHTESKHPTKSGAENWVQITVMDTGVGIPPDQLPHIFERFFQADNQQYTGVGGSGIGLALTHELVKLMGGDISVASELGKGTTFEVKLPIRHAAETEAGETTQQHQLNRAKSIPNPPPTHPQLLLVEDNPDIVEYLTNCLGPHYQLDFAYNGRAGIDRALMTIPDLIISDVMMPEKDGFEVCEFLKNDERTSHIPIVLLTAKAGVEDRIAGLQRGADAYLAKPFHPDELRAVLANLFELRKKLQAKYGGEWSIGDRLSDTHNAQPPITNIPLSQHLNIQSPDPEDAFLQKLRTVVEERLTETDLTVEEISRMVGMSYPVVHRKVTALTGRSLTLYVRIIRLQKARLLLADPALSISEVAYQTGFNDPKFFSRVFSEEFGMSPTAWRNVGS